jgi:hypothetical protein
MVEKVGGEVAAMMAVREDFGKQERGGRKTHRYSCIKYLA